MTPEDKKEYHKKWSAENREHLREYKKKWIRLNHAHFLKETRAYRRKTIDSRREVSRKWVRNNKEKHTKSVLAWRRKNIERHRKTQRSWRKKQMLTNPDFRIAVCFRDRVRDALKNGYKKAYRSKELLGCSWEHLRTWLTFWFQPGMSWSNYGSVWHVDHRRPCASFNLSDPRQQKECFHFSNLQPLFAGDNLRKGDKWQEIGS